jgi:hypothetical protein
MQRWKVVVGNVRCFTTGTGNIKGNPAFAKTAKTGAPANSNTNSNSKTESKPQARQNNCKMNYPSGIIGGATRSIVESTDTKGRATRQEEDKRKEEEKKKCEKDPQSCKK